MRCSAPRMARSAAEQKNGLTAISAVVVSATKKSLVHLIRRPQVIPMFGGEFVERKHCVAIFRQALGRLVVLRSVFLGKDVDRHFGRSS